MYACITFSICIQCVCVCVCVCVWWCFSLQYRKLERVPGEASAASNRNNIILRPRDRSGNASSRPHSDGPRRQNAAPAPRGAAPTTALAALALCQGCALQGARPAVDADNGEQGAGVEGGGEEEDEE